VIVLSAAHDARKQAAALGASGFFTKPIKLDKLLDAVRVHC
jgi:DNA-binding response OmpR family regulator